MLTEFMAAGPHSVALMLTTRCNQSCAYCYQDRKVSRSMGIDVLEQSLAQFLASDCQEPSLTLYGGEPLLEAGLVRSALAIVRERKPSAMRPDVRIFTNGLLVDRETARLLVEANVHMTLSIDGLPGAQDFRRPGSFEVVDRLLLALAEDHPDHLEKRVAIAMTLTSANVALLADSFCHFVRRRVREIRVVPVFTYDSGWGPAACDELNSQLARMVGESLAVKASTGAVPFLCFRPVGEHTSPQDRAVRLCGTANRKELFVDVDGALAPCAAMSRSSLKHATPLLRDALETLGEFPIGDPDLNGKLAAREERVPEIPFLRGKLRKCSPRGKCSDCPALGDCFVCPVSIALGGEGTDPDMIPAVQCDFNRLVAFHRARFHRRTRQV